MPKNVAVLHGGNLASIQVQIRSANGGGRHPQYDVVGGFDNGIGDRFDFDVTGTVVSHCAHGYILTGQ